MYEQALTLPGGSQFHRLLFQPHPYSPCLPLHTVTEAEKNKTLQDVSHFVLLRCMKLRHLTSGEGGGQGILVLKEYD